MEGKEKEEKREEEKKRENLLILSSFPRYLVVGVCRSKRQSLSLWRGLRENTRIEEFQQTLRGRGFFFLLDFYS